MIVIKLTEKHVRSITSRCHILNNSRIASRAAPQLDMVNAVARVISSIAVSQRPIHAEAHTYITSPENNSDTNYPQPVTQSERESSIQGGSQYQRTNMGEMRSKAVPKKGEKYE